MRKTLAALLMLAASCGMEYPDPVDATYDFVRVDHVEPMPPPLVPEEYSARPPRMAVPPPWAPPEPDPWDDLVNPPQPEPPPCIVCEDEDQR